MVTYFKRFLLLASITTLSLVPPAHAESPTKVDASTQKEVLLQTSRSWDGQPYVAYPKGAPELTVLKITIPANSELAWHKHPMPNAAYVLSGSLTVQKKSTGEKKTLKAGDVLPELVNQVHRGHAGDAPVVLLVFYAGTEGMPLSEGD